VDFCRNGQYTEHGSSRSTGSCGAVPALPDALVKLDSELGALGVLLEPTSVVAKAWEQAERTGNRAQWRPERAV